MTFGATPAPRGRWRLNCSRRCAVEPNWSARIGILFRAVVHLLPLRQRRRLRRYGKHAPL